MRVHKAKQSREELGYKQWGEKTLILMGEYKQQWVVIKGSNAEDTIQKELGCNLTESKTMLPQL